MQRIKAALEALDEIISELEDKVELDVSGRQADLKRQAEIMKTSRSREAGVIAITQKVATRLDQTINHVERILRD